MVTAASVATETLQPSVFLSMLDELDSAINTYSNGKTSKASSTEAASRAMLSVRKIVHSCQSFDTSGDFLKFLHHCEQRLGITTPPFNVPPVFDSSVRDTREYLVLLNQWLTHHNLNSLDQLSAQINRTGRIDREAEERMGNIKTLLSQCEYSSTPSITPLPVDNTDGLVHVRANFDSRYVLKEHWYHHHISSDGTQKNFEKLDKVAELSQNLVDNFRGVLDPDADGSLINILAGTSTQSLTLPDGSLLQQIKQLKSYNPEFKGPFDINQNINLWFTKISSSAIALFWQKLLRGSALWLNKGFGLFPNVNILDSISSIGRGKDEHYQNVKALQTQAVTEADKLHKMLDTAGVIVANLEGCDLEQHLAAARMVADKIQNANIPGLTIDKNVFLDNVRLSFNQPGYKSYFVLHLMNAVRYAPLQNKCEQLLPQMVANGLEDMRDLLMPLDKQGNRKPPSLFAMLNALKTAAVVRLSDTSGQIGNFASMLNTPNLKSQAELLSKTFFQNSALSPLYHIITKMGLSIEQLEHPGVVHSFAAKRVQSRLRDFWIRNVVPSVAVVCDPIVSLWNLPKRIPVFHWVTGFPTRIVEGIHGAAGSVLSIVPFIGKHLENTWKLLTPSGLLQKNLEFKGTFHANNAAQFCLDAMTTPFLDLRSQLDQLSKNISSSSTIHLIMSAGQNLRNITTFLPAFITEQAKAERCGVHMPEAVFKRLGIPLEGQPPTMATFVQYYQKMIRRAYNDLYGEEGNATYQHTPPTIMDKNPYGNNNAPFGVQYIDVHGKTITEFSDRYFDHVTGTRLVGPAAKQKNEEDFKRCEQDALNAHLALKSELSNIMKTGVLSYIDSISSVASVLQQTTSNMVESAKKLVSPSSILGNYLVRPTPATVAKESGFFSKYMNIAKEVAGTMFHFRMPISYPNTFGDQQLCH